MDRKYALEMWWIMLRVKLEDHEFRYLSIRASGSNCRRIGLMHDWVVAHTDYNGWESEL